MPSPLHKAWSVYQDRRMLTLVFLGFSSGLPLLLIYSTLSLWLMDQGLDIATVGLFAATSTPYSLKFLWAPLLDRAPLPWLTRRLGQRRGWLLTLQCMLIASLLALASTNPAQDSTLTAIAALITAIFSASQDVVIDAYRVETLQEHEQGAGAAAAVFGYRLGMLAAGGGALAAAEMLSSWSAAYILMASLMLVGVFTSLTCSEPPPPTTLPPNLPSPWHTARDAVWGPLRDLTKRPAWVPILLFVMLYKLGDALASTMTNPMLHSLGFEKLHIAGIANTYGLVASIAGVFIGGALVRQAGLVGALWIGGAMQMLSNIMLVIQANVGFDLWVLTATIGVENLTGGIGTAAFVAFLSTLCNRQYTASQYALLTAAAGLLKTTLATTTGHMAQAVGWSTFFGLTTAAALPGLLILAWLSKDNRMGAYGGET